MDPAVATVVIVLIALLALWMIGRTFRGAAAMMVAASEFGFIGVAFYFMMWIIIFPFMLGLSLVVGLFTS